MVWKKKCRTVALHRGNCNGLAPSENFLNSTRIAILTGIVHARIGLLPNYLMCWPLGLSWKIRLILMVWRLNTNRVSNFECTTNREYSADSFARQKSDVRVHKIRFINADLSICIWTEQSELTTIERANTHTHIKRNFAKNIYIAAKTNNNQMT